MQIWASDIDFWNKKYDSETMKMRHKRRMYPPRVKMTVCMRSSDQQFKLIVKFLGCSHDSQLDVELAFPQGNNSCIMHAIPCNVTSWIFLIELSLRSISHVQICESSSKIRCELYVVQNCMYLWWTLLDYYCANHCCITEFKRLHIQWNLP